HRARRDPTRARGGGEGAEDLRDRLLRQRLREGATEAPRRGYGGAYLAARPEGRRPTPEPHVGEGQPDRAGRRPARQARPAETAQEEGEQGSMKIVYTAGV